MSIRNALAWAITPTAYDAICSTLSRGAPMWPPQGQRGNCLIDVEAAVVDRLAAMRGPEEDYRDVILRLAQLERAASGLLLCAVLIALAHAKMLHLHRKAPALGYQHASKRDELVFLRIIETRVQGLGGLDNLLENCRALREAVRRRIQAVHRRQVIALLLLQGDEARLGAVLDCGFKRAPKLFLVGVQPKTGLHALDLGVESRLRPTLHELGVRGLLIALCGGGGDGETGSGEIL